jgi:alkylation response protein AidB-like acyl-CoA dehydrogenase
MDLNRSAVQRELRSGLRDYLADAWPPDRLRAAADAGRLDLKPWRELAGLGLFGLMRPEENGGMGLAWAWLHETAYGTAGEHALALAETL